MNKSPKQGNFFYALGFNWREILLTHREWQNFRREGSPGRTHTSVSSKTPFTLSLSNILASLLNIIPLQFYNWLFFWTTKAVQKRKILYFFVYAMLKMFARPSDCLWWFTEAKGSSLFHACKVQIRGLQYPVPVILMLCYDRPHVEQTSLL